MITSSLVVAIIVAASVACARIVRSAAGLVVACVALRRSTPAQRAAILLALEPVVRALGGPGPPPGPPGSGRGWGRDRPAAGDAAASGAGPSGQAGP